MLPVLLTSLVCATALTEGSDEWSLERSPRTQCTYRYSPVADVDFSLAGSQEDQWPSTFGQTGEAYWLANMGGGSDFSTDHFGRVGGGVEYFMAQDISIGLELNVIYFSQSGPDAWGANLNLLFRWHFLHDEARTWTVYVDGGAGMLWTTNDVPAEGSKFNFTPQFGAGASFDLGNAMRLYAGARWFHVSNARLYEENPGREFGLFYVMVGWPF